MILFTYSVSVFILKLLFRYVVYMSLPRCGCCPAKLPWFVACLALPGEFPQCMAQINMLVQLNKHNNTTDTDTCTDTDTDTYTCMWLPQRATGNLQLLCPFTVALVTYERIRCCQLPCPAPRCHLPS